MSREGPFLQRAGLRAVRSAGMAAWRLGERLGVDPFGATEMPWPAADAERSATFDGLVEHARSRDGVVDVFACPYPLHELLAHLVVEHRLLLHGSNHRELDVLEPRPARDGATTLQAVVASDDAVWPLFYAVLARDLVPRIFSACTHVGRPPRPRRFYLFAIEGDPGAASTWVPGTMYALPRAGFRREWGNEWVSPVAVRPELRVHVEQGDFPLREDVVGLASPEEFRHVIRHLRAAKQGRQKLTNRSSGRAPSP